MKALILSALLALSPIKSTAGSLILFVDASYSLSNKEIETQFKGYEQSLLEFEYMKDTRVEVILFSSTSYLVADNYHDAIEFFRTYRTSLREKFPDLGKKTCTSRAIRTFIERADDLPKPLIVDISTDGPDNCGGQTYFNESIAELNKVSSEVNAILIKDPAMTTMTDAEFVALYAQAINGEYWFIEDHAEFAEAIYDKLVIEVASLGIDFRQF